MRKLLALALSAILLLPAITKAQFDPIGSGGLGKPLTIPYGGTGASTEFGARTNLSVPKTVTCVNQFARILDPGTSICESVHLANDTTSILPISKGGLGLSSATNGLVLGNGSSYSAYSGTNCSSQFITALSASGVATCFNPGNPNDILQTNAQGNGIQWRALPQDNPIINPAMEIWQRGTTFTSPSSNTFTADRWVWARNGTGHVTITQGIDVPPIDQAGMRFAYSLRIQVTTTTTPAAGDFYFIAQPIEGYNWRHFAHRQFTISFWVRDGVTGEHAVFFTNAGHDQSFVGTYVINAANAWEYKTITVPASPGAGTWNYTNGSGLRIGFVLLAGSAHYTTPGSWQSGNFLTTATAVNSMGVSNNVFAITGVKLELGSVATPLQFRPFQEEFKLCQRYFEKSFALTTAPAQNVGLGTGEWRFPQVVSSSGGAIPHSTIPFKVRKRGPPTIILYNPAAANAQARNIDLANDASGTTVSNISEYGFAVHATSSGAQPQHTYGIHWIADSEL